MSLSIRGRLSLWYTAVLSLALAFSGEAFYLIHSRSRLAQVDQELERAGALAARALSSELQEGAKPVEAAREAIDIIDLPGRSLAILDAAGAPLASQWEALPPGTAEALGRGGGDTSTVETPTGAFRVRRLPYSQGETTYELRVAEPLAALDNELATLRRALAASVVFTLVLGIVGGSWIARAALRPVTLMAAQARRITDRTPGFQLTSPNPRDELGLLARAFNDLLSRLESALSQQRRFMADASHELRTPVSIARTAIEVTLDRQGRPEDEYRDALGVVRGQMRRLSRIVDYLFTLARADVGGLPVERRPLYLDELVADCVKDAKVLAAPKGVEVDWRGPSDLEAHGDERLLREMLINLLDNAVRHTPHGGWVRVDLAATKDAVELAVSDSGEGIPETEHERVFERFVRLRPSLSREGGGLGLPIARAIAEAHGGTLRLARSDPSGSTFLAWLPLPQQTD